MTYMEHEVAPTRLDELEKAEVSRSLSFVSTVRGNDVHNRGNRRLQRRVNNGSLLDSI